MLESDGFVEVRCESVRFWAVFCLFGSENLGFFREIFVEVLLLRKFGDVIDLFCGV